ncbi:MFS transporter [Sphingomonas crocodyli]|uniref:MFS transporter n=1 Tax=Sphingomonas crocodyli TaxID=1979270 RepID=A0A437LWJ2_9SPHN|nr:MFS transporter [Sphingomonas crocodyli]RVT89762.1 MFS transporter [Sphingomonas crocodyli]
MTADTGRRGSTTYQAYVLFVLFAVNVLNFADRSILSMLADPIKHDLALTDAQIGMLVGTFFVLLNSIAGLAMGAIVDGWLRNRLLAVGVGLWSALTALSGLSTSFVQLALARIGVGLGEAVGSPVSHSLIGDVFTAEGRGRAFALFFCAPSVGIATCLAISGGIVQAWPQQCGALGLCEVAAWKVPFFVFGVPGLIFAVLAAFIRDPAGDALTRRDARPGAVAMREIVALLPPFSIIVAGKLAGARGLRINLTIAAIVVGIAGVLIAMTGDWVQWISVGAAFYALGSWAQGQYHRDPAVHALTTGSPAFLSAVLGAALVGTASGAIGFWCIPFALREIGMDHAQAGRVLGLCIAGGSISGTLLGGLIADRWRRSNPAAALWVAGFSMVGSAAATVAMINVRDPAAYAVAVTGFMIATTMWAPGIAALVQDLIPTPMRGRVAALYTVSLTLIGMSAGPYMIGKVADLSGSLRIAMLSPYAALPPCLLLLAFAMRRLSAAYRARDQYLTEMIDGL